MNGRKCLTILSLLLSLSVCGLAQTAQTTIVQGRNIVSGSGGQASGTIVIVPNVAFTAADGFYIDVTPITATITSGSFDQALEPTPVGVWYNVTWKITNRPSRLATWVVPALFPTVSLSSVEIPSSTSFPTPSLFSSLQLGDIYNVGSGGVVQYEMVVKDASNPSRVIIPASGDCGFGIALTTVSTPGLPVTVQWGGIASLLADNTVTAGHVIVGGTTTPGRGRDSGETDETVIAANTCIVGFARTSAAVGSSFQIQLRGERGATGAVGPTPSATPNKVLASDTSGSSTSQATMRSLVLADIPGLSSLYEPVITSGLVSEYWAGTKVWRNFSTDVLSAMQAALDLKAGLGANTFTGNQTVGTTVLDPTNGIKGPVIACVGAPGNMTGPYGSLCEVRATGAMWACTNAAGCTVSGDWAAAGGSGTVTSVTIAGTANQITVTGTCTGTTTISCTLSIPSTLQLPGTINRITLTQPATGATITVVDGKTLTVSNSVTLTATDGSSVAFGAGGTVLYTTSTIPVPAVFPVGVCGPGATGSSGLGLPINALSSGPVPDCLANITTLSNTNPGVLRFPAGQGSTAYAEYSFNLPSTVDCTQAMDVQLVWVAAAITNSVTWDVITAFSADAATLDPTFNTASAVSHAPQGATYQARTDTISNITKTGCAAGSRMFLRIYRSSADTMTGDAILAEATLIYRRTLQ